MEKRERQDFFVCLLNLCSSFLDLPSSTYPTNLRSAQRNLSKSIEEAALHAYNDQDPQSQQTAIVTYDDLNIFPTITRPVITQVATDHQQRRQTQELHQSQQQQQQLQYQQKINTGIEDAMVSSVGMMVCQTNVQQQQRVITGDNNSDSSDSNQTITLTSCPTGHISTTNALAKKSGLRNDVNFTDCAIEHQASSQHATLITGSSTSSSSANSSSVSSPQHESYESGTVVTTETAKSAGGQTMQQQQQHQQQQQQQEQERHHHQEQHQKHLMTDDITHSPQLSSHIVTTNSNCGSSTTTGVRNAFISDTGNLSPPSYDCKYWPNVFFYTNRSYYQCNFIQIYADHNHQGQFEKEQKKMFENQKGIMLGGSSFCDLRYFIITYDYR